MIKMAGRIIVAPVPGTAFYSEKKGSVSFEAELVTIINKDKSGLRTCCIMNNVLAVHSWLLRRCPATVCNDIKGC